MGADEPGGGPFPLPPAVPVTRSHLDAIASRHGVEADRLEPLASPGIINTVYRLGQELVLRVPRDHEGHIAQAYREACAIPAAVACGVRTPRLVVFDDSREILPVPFLIVERVEGADAESLGVERPPPSDTWASVGADLARLHRFAPPALPPPEPWMLSRHGPRELVEARAREGWCPRGRLAGSSTGWNAWHPFGPPRARSSSTAISRWPTCSCIP